MSELTDLKLNYLKATKQAIREALIAKGQTVASTDSFRSYAGKIAALTVTSGESGVKAKWGKFTPEANGAANTIQHGLGVVPDVVVILPAKAPASAADAGLLGCVNFSLAFSEASGAKGVLFLPNGNQFAINDVSEYHLTANTQPQITLGLPRGATEEQFLVGGNSATFYSSSIPYCWVAFGNLFNA